MLIYFSRGKHGQGTSSKSSNSTSSTIAVAGQQFVDKTKFTHLRMGQYWYSVIFAIKSKQILLVVVLIDHINSTQNFHWNNTCGDVVTKTRNDLK